MSTAELQNRLAAAKQAAQRTVHKLAQVVDLRQQITDAETRLAQLEQKAADERGRLQALNDRLDAVQGDDPV